MSLDIQQALSSDQDFVSKYPGLAQPEAQGTRWPFSNPRKAHEHRIQLAGNSSHLITNTCPPSPHHSTRRIMGPTACGRGAAESQGEWEQLMRGRLDCCPSSHGLLEASRWAGQSLSSAQSPAGSSIQGRLGLPIGPAKEHKRKPSRWGKRGRKTEETLVCHQA